MARMKISAEALRKRRRARELKRKESEAKPGSEDEENKGYDVCAICDNGGNLTCCDGGCKRSFHLDDSEGSTCRLALGLTKDEAKMITDTEEAFICKNCKYKQHQCFACGRLGSSSDESSSSPELFQCDHHDDCGRFYHPKCVAKLLYSDEEMAALFEHQITAGVGFICPLHECCVCKKVEDKGDEDMQFAVCRRCPTTYHRKCLPEEILFETKRGPNGPMQRAWDNLLPDRVLIFCMKHDIVRKLRTPARDHIVFPDAENLLDAATKTPEYSPMERDVVSEGAEREQLYRHLFYEPSEPPPSAASNMNQPPLSAASNKNQPPPSAASNMNQPPPSAASNKNQPPLSGATNKNQCICSGHMDSFAPKALFMNPQPGSCGWISGDDDE